MAARIQRTMTLMLGGTSLTAGRLCNPPLPWTYYLFEDMKASPECQGPVRIINTGAGSQTSNFGASQAILKAPLRPTHVLMEDFAINDCAIGPVTIPQATANFNSMVASYRAANPDVIIAHQTMSPASAGDASRTNLPAYYDNGLANAALNGLLSLDNYYGTLLVPGGWPKPLDPAITVGAGFIPDTPAGFTPISAGFWNPADKNVDITLTADNLIATRTADTGAPAAAVRANQGVSSGKSYFEATPTFGGEVSAGIGSAASSLAIRVGEQASSWGAVSNGLVLNGGGLVVNIGSYTSGTRICVALDLVNNRLWFRKDLGIWNNSGAANPSTNVGGIVIPAGTYFPMVSISNVGSSWAGVFGNGDGLHPLWANGFQLYSYPNILAWARQAMADFW